AGFFADLVADAAAAVRFFVRFFFFAVVLPVVAAAPEVTRVECFGRCLTFLAAASAGHATVKAASSATSNTLIVLRIITRPPWLRSFTRHFCLSDFSGPAEAGPYCCRSGWTTSGRLYSRYARAKPICATNIMRYMCAHETWFASTASSSGRRNIRYR